MEHVVINGVNRVLLGVADQDVAKDFWMNTIGFELLQDTTMGDERWVEVRPPGGAGPIISLVASSSTTGPEQIAPTVPTSDVFFECDDIVATHAELTARGVPFAQPPVKQFFGWWAMFETPYGERHALEQRGDEPLHTNDAG